MVLLKNEGAALPLAKGRAKIALIGPLADNQKDPLGTWAAKGRPEDVVTVLAGIRAISPETTVQCVKGCDFVGDGREGFDEAVRAAKDSDVVVAVMGERQDMSGEAHSRTDIGLPGPQLDLLKALHATGKPVILVLMNGRPMSLPWEAEHLPAILVAWHLGITAGTAIAEALFGDVNPSGKLPASFPRSAGHCPIYLRHQGLRPTQGEHGRLEGRLRRFADGTALSVWPRSQLRQVRIRRSQDHPGQGPSKRQGKDQRDRGERERSTQATRSFSSMSAIRWPTPRAPCRS